MSSDLERLFNLPSKGVAAKAAQLLIHLAKRFPKPGQNFVAPVYPIATAIQKMERSTESVYPLNLLTADESSSLEFIAAAYVEDVHELAWVIDNVLIAQQYLQKGYSDGHLQISAGGWQEWSRLQTINQVSALGFVAMRFTSEYLPLFSEGVEPGIRSAGFEACRIDGIPHNNRIDDEIIATIKRSRFLVADFSENRGGIYFEAGYALGLGMPVIWTVREDMLKEVHFDNRQYNFLTWKPDLFADLAKRLAFRIEATIGRGPKVH